MTEKESYFNAFFTKTYYIEKVQEAYTRIAYICGDLGHIMHICSVRMNGGDV